VIGKEIAVAVDDAEGGRFKSSRFHNNGKFAASLCLFSRQDYR
jgi:hypothetical protein